MITPPRLFDAKGNFDDAVNLTGLDPKMVALAETVRAESHAVKAAEQTFADANAEVIASEQALKTTRTYHDAHYPPQTFHSLWLETFKGK
jgi:hypothetical protein